LINTFNLPYQARYPSQIDFTENLNILNSLTFLCFVCHRAKRFIWLIKESLSNPKFPFLKRFFELIHHKTPIYITDTNEIAF